MLIEEKIRRERKGEERDRVKEEERERIIIMIIIKVRNNSWKCIIKNQSYALLFPF